MKRTVLYLSVLLVLALVLYGCKPQQNYGAPSITENGGTADETENREEIDLLPEDPSADIQDAVPTDIPTEAPTDLPTEPPTAPPANIPVNPSTNPPTDPPTDPPEEEKEEATSQNGIQLPVIPG